MKYYCRNMTNVTSHANLNEEKVIHKITKINPVG